MKTVRCEYCGKKFSAEEEQCPFCGTERIVFHEGETKLKWYMAHHYSVQKAPFTRFMARMIDVLLSVLLTELLLGPVLARYMGGTMGLQLLVFIGLIVQLLLEPFLMAIFGYTPGKRLLCVAIRDQVGEKKPFLEYFKRSFGVLFWGFGFLLPGVSLFTLYFSYVRIAHGEPTHWDEEQNTVVLQKKFNLVFAVSAVVIIALLCVAIFNLSHVIFSFYDSMN